VVEELIYTQTLDNRLVLKIYDISRRMAADRWVVSLAARIDIPIDELVLSEGGGAVPGRDDLIGTLGPKVTFEQRFDRKFVDAGEKEKVLRDMQDGFLKGTATYLAHPCFARRFALKQFRQKRERRLWDGSMDD
jgi:hypothetical protein